MNSRQLKGREIAERTKIERHGSQWFVPSQSGGGKYIVDVESQPPFCNCPDYELRGMKCKHIYAVEYTIRYEKETRIEATCTEEGTTVTTTVTETTTKTKRVTYRQDWPAYNAAQTQEKALFQSLLADLCRAIPEPTQGMGRPRLPYRDMVFSMAFKVYSTVSGRRFSCDLAAAYEHGYLSHVPHYNSIFRYFETPELTGILRTLIERASLALKMVETTFAVDASGFTTCQYVRWYDAKYGREVDMRDWLKVHLMCGTTTNIVSSVEITGRYTHDSQMFQPLVDATAKHFTLSEVTADKAYLSRGNLARVVKHGAMPYIPFKSNSTTEPGSAKLWDRLFALYMLDREAFLDHYHARSNVETTFQMIKAKFGAAIRSKTETAQVNELLCKILCHNICVVIQSMYELGIEADFGTP